MRTADVDPSVYEPLETALVEEFFPAAFGWTPKGDPALREMCALPTRLNGLAIPKPSELAARERASSKQAGSELVDGIKRQDLSYRQDGRAIALRKEQTKEYRKKVTKELAQSLLPELKGRAQRSLEEAMSCERGEDWLSHAPLQHFGLLLDRQTFRDAIAIRMGVDFPDPLPETCPSCGDPFDLRHGLKCKSVNWIKRRHDEVKKVWMTLFKRVSPTVTLEPFPGSPDGMKKKSTTRDLEARCDLLVTGLLRPGCLSMSDVHRHLCCLLRASEIDRCAEREGEEENRQVRRTSGGHRRCLCPARMLSDRVLAPEATKVLSLVVHDLDVERPEMKSTAKMLQVSLQIAILKATSLGLRARARTVPPQECRTEEPS